MNSTKRKFNALLQGLGSSRPQSNDDTSRRSGSRPQTFCPTNTAFPGLSSQATGPDAELLQKRQRLGLPESTAPVFTRRSSLSAAISSITSRKADNQTSSIKWKDSPARYSPTDRVDLLKRLATFQEITDWTPKPDKVNEVEWAKRGWVCHGKETVRCLLCHRELVVKLNRKVVDGEKIPVLLSSEIEDALVDKYAELIVNYHQEECLWRKRGCDDTLLRLSLANASSSLKALRERYDELITRKSFLPYEFNLRLPEGLDVDQILSQLPADFFTAKNLEKTTEQQQQQPNRVAFTLALLGWQGLSNARIGAVPNSASCHTCLRRLGLWMFKSKEVSESGEVIVPAPMDSLDPVREHRFFCPWSNADVQKQAYSHSQGQENMPGWRVLAQTLANEAHLRGVYEGRSPAQSRKRAQTTAPSTPQRPTTAASTHTPQTPSASIQGSAHKNMGDNENDEEQRDAKDKERWARLRRVKSLFETKGSRRLRHSISRPGTGHSTKSSGGQKE